MATMRHKGYIARSDYDEDREVFHGRVGSVCVAR